MRKQARRLWLGDWRRDEEPDRGDDTVVITPVDEEDAPLTTGRPPNRQRQVAAVAAVAFVAALAFAVLSGGDDTRVVSEQPQTPSAQVPAIPAPTPQAQPQFPQGGQQRGFGGPDLTGPEATKAAEAALAQFPGEIERVTAGPSGDGYVVHVIQADGNEVHVLVDEDFHVQGSDAGSGRRSFGPGRSQ